MIIVALIILLSLLVIWTWINRLFMPRLPQPIRNLPHDKEVTILVPLRNEERNVVDLLTSLQALTYKNLSFVFLDDHSKDKTYSLLKHHSKKLKQVEIICGKPLPKGWVGKVHACHQLGQRATGDYFLFIDADIRLEPNTIEQALTLMNTEQVGLLSGFPRFPTTTWLSQLLVPMQHVVVLLHLPLFKANRTIEPAFTAAHGAFMLFTKETYEQVGGHKTVKSSLVEDVHITRAVKQIGKKACLANVTDSVTCQMYETNREVWKGFSKNIFPGLGRSIPLVVFLTIFYLAVFVAPLPLAMYGLVKGSILFIIPLLLTWLVRLIIDVFTRQDRFLWLLMPFAALALLATMYYSMYLGLKGKGFEWKGRRYT
ncbi:glycosyltransferase [Halalkalibacter nanhaiisediminis]|uniref:Cellulose synthase/poly-beta-1,6-N-acetylglucosamine synthase-like glycosyltransferase n=1 Tax=Halalkalibacter nanhaiisediminis TaxID=688079 RepID=A0A562QMG7_9BACI|nr:glycosyltransferase family 2 protein [Halalkalibacter nanhaiisediminis]TWI57951.1 cellulose synthase/poly-beta-1,6-N-acetylglucosamine synthase-like glycosyltransferase [Halalkalibacter nanhaiisediminis]